MTSHSTLIHVMGAGRILGAGRVLGAGLVLALASPAALADGFVENWRLSGFETPESALYDPGNDRIIVSNIAGFGPDTGMDGYLSLVSTDGELIEQKWVAGLMDPKGMAILGDHLYVADAIGLHEISLADGSLIQTIALEGAQFPNDVTVDDNGNIYVSDMFGEAIFKVADGVAENWLTDPALTLPNGLLADGGNLVVGSMGANMNFETFQTESPGGIILVDIETGEVTPVEKASGLGGLDGVAKIGDMFLVNDNPTGTIYAWGYGTRPADDAIVISPGTADMSAYGNTILVPMLNDGELISMTFEE